MEMVSSLKWKLIKNYQFELSIKLNWNHEISQVITKQKNQHKHILIVDFIWGSRFY